MAKYIIEIEDVPSMVEDGFTFYKCVDAPWWYISDMHINRLKQYEDTKPKTGRWIPLQLPMAYPPYQCDCCFGNAPMVETGKLMNRHLEALLTDFCPNCGADMRGKKDE